MKKEKLITRTIVSTVASFKAFDVEKACVFDDVLTFAGKLTEKETEQSIIEMFEFDTKKGGKAYKFIMLVSLSYDEKLYGVTESAFLEIAKELPPRKANETQEDD